MPVSEIMLTFVHERNRYAERSGKTHSEFAGMQHKAHPETVPDPETDNVRTVERQTKEMHIAIAGNIGAGKTTLTKMLAKHYGWEPRFEPVVVNPYLEDYYADIPRWSFCLETYFLKQRFKDMLDIVKADHTIIQDRSIFEGVYVFVRNNYELGNLSDRDYETYMELFQLMMKLTQLPDLMIYLRKSIPALVAQIQKRGREYEQTMQIDYLKGLNERYDDFIFNQYKGKVLVIESDHMDFENRPEDFRSIVNKIDASLFGLFPLETEINTDAASEDGHR